MRGEVGTALKRGVRVIPVLGGAVMPQAGQLPEELKPLACRYALSVSHDRSVGIAGVSRRLRKLGEALRAVSGLKSA